MKQAITRILFLAILVGTVSCGEAKDPSTDTTKSDDTTTAPPAETLRIPEPELPEKNYNGDTFTFLIRGGEMIGYHDKWIDAETITGETVNDAIFKRNTETEQKFNITIETIIPGGDGWHGEIESMARQYIQANDNTIDVISNMRSSLGELAVEGLLHNFKDLDYVNLEAEYWDRNAVEQLTIVDKLYMMPSDISMGNFSQARFMYFNKGIQEEYKLESPYDLVEANEWTLDKMLEMTTKVSEDLNGDGKFDHNDRYGFLTDDSSNGTISSLVAGTGIQTVKVDKDEILKIDLMTEKVQDVLTKCFKVFENTDYAVSSEELVKMGDASSYANTYDYGRKLFSDGQFLFYNSGINSMNMFRDMKQDFGVVPNPKYDENQEGYYHKVDSFALLFGIPLCTADVERTAIVMEYMAWLSNKEVLPAYYEQTIQGKRLRDDRDIEMLDLIKQSILYDYSDLYRLGGADVIYAGYKGENLSSNYAAFEPSIKAKINELIATFSEID